MLRTRSLLFASMSIVTLALTLAARPAAAEVNQGIPDIQISGVIYGGNGCPQGTASVILSDDKTKFTILFDEYIAETEGTDWNVRKSCNLAVSLSIPAGYSVALLWIDYRGYALIPARGRGVLRAEYFFAGGRGPLYTRNFPRGFDDNYLFTDVVRGRIWSPCGEDVIARANTSIQAQKASRYSEYDATVMVDSVDLRAGIEFHIDWRYC